MNIPKKFVSLHSHDGSSVYDGLGSPIDHITFCKENGLDAWAATNHGHCNSFAMAYMHVQKLKKAGENFKFIPGCELYLHPSLAEWRDEYNKQKELKEDLKRQKIEAKKNREGKKKFIEIKKDDNDEPIEVEFTNSLTIENEDETKGSTKYFNPVNRRHHLVVVPKTSRGLEKLFHLVSRGYLEGFYRFPRIDFEMLKEAGKDGDLIVSTACLGGLLSFNTLRACQEYDFDSLNASMLDDDSLRSRIFKDISNSYDRLIDSVGYENVYLELQFNRLSAQDLVNRAVIEFAKKNGLNDKLIVTSDSHYARPELWKERELYKKLGWMNYQDYNPNMIPSERSQLKAELYPKNADQIWDSYFEAKDTNAWYDDDVICDAIERTYGIAHDVIGDITFDTSYKYPTRALPKDKTPFEALCEMAKAGIRKKGFGKDKRYVDRLTYELKTVKQMDNAAYFVTLAKAINLARDVALVGVARGSSGGSLICYCIGITDLDPIKYDLQFERFLNVHRAGAPDIDTDVSDRDRVLEVLRNEFGYNNVVPISNVNVFKVKSLLKDLAKFHGVPFEEANIATRSVEQEVRKATMKHGDDKNLFILKYDDALKHSPSFCAFIEKYPQVGEHISTLFKEQRSLGRHAGGVLLLDDAPKQMPLIANKGEPQTPWSEGVAGKFLEPVGFLKLDLLGLETLRLIERTIELILKKEGNDKPSFHDIRAWYNNHLHPDANDYDDQKVYEYVYHDGRFPGIFQCTSAGAQQFFVKAKPTSITDIAALTSIYRPGPLAANVDRIYLEAKKGNMFDWGHPAFEEVLGKTYNCLVFQEQVMSLAEHIGGFPKDQCDNVRRAIMKRDMSKGDTAIKEAKQMEDAFVNGAIQKGIPENTARKSYQQILWMAGYGFNASHATAYAIDSYMCAWLLTYYEEEWLCAYLESMSSNDDNRAKAFSEVRSMGYEIVPIDIKDAGMGWKILPGKRMMPSMLACKGVGEAAVIELEQLRPITSIENLFWDENHKWKLSKFNKRALEAMINVQAFDQLGIVGEDKLFKNYHHMHRVIIEHHNEIKKSKKSEPKLGKQRFYELIKEYENTPEWTKEEKIKNIIKHFGSVDVNQLVPKTVINKLIQKGIKNIDEYDRKDLYWFCVVKATPRKTRNNRNYLLIEGVGLAGKTYRIFMWSWDGKLEFNSYAMVMCELSHSDFGFATSQKKLRILNVM